MLEELWVLPPPALFKISLFVQRLDSSERTRWWLHPPLGGWVALSGDCRWLSLGEGWAEDGFLSPRGRRQAAGGDHRMATSHLWSIRASHALHIVLSLKSEFTRRIHLAHPPVTIKPGHQPHDLEQVSSALWPSVFQLVKCKDPLGCTQPLVHKRVLIFIGGDSTLLEGTLPRGLESPHLAKEGVLSLPVPQNHWEELVKCTDSGPAPRPTKGKSLRVGQKSVLKIGSQMTLTYLLHELASGSPLLGHVVLLCHPESPGRLQLPLRGDQRALPKMTQPGSARAHKAQCKLRRGTHLDSWSLCVRVFSPWWARARL